MDIQEIYGNNVVPDSLIFNSTCVNDKVKRNIFYTLVIKWIKISTF